MWKEQVKQIKSAMGLKFLSGMAGDLSSAQIQLLATGNVPEIVLPMDDEDLGDKVDGEEAYLADIEDILEATMYLDLEQQNGVAGDA